MHAVSQAFQRLVLRSRAGGFSGQPEKGQVQDEMLDQGTSALRGEVRDKRATLSRITTGEAKPAKVIEVGTARPEARPEARSDTKPGSAVPQKSPDTPTTRLRPEGGKRGAASRPGVQVPRIEEPPVAAAPAEAVPVAVAPEARPALPPLAPPEREAPRPAPAEAHAALLREGVGAKAQPPMIEPLGELVSRAAGGDEQAAEQLLAGGDAAARAVVMALPGPLKSRERQALGDPIGEPVYARGPLLGLVPRLGQAAVQPLLERLDNPVTPPEVRYYVALCFSEVPVSEAIAPLGRRLFDNDDAVRMAAVTALRNAPPGPALRDLMETLRSDLLGPDARRQQHAAEALGELRDVHCVPRLIQLLGSPDLLLGNAAAVALRTITKQDFGKGRFFWRRWWRRHQAEPRLQWMLAGLCHQSVAVRASAQDELRRLCGDAAGYRFDLPQRERQHAARRWAAWWQRCGYAVYPP